MTRLDALSADLDRVPGTVSIWYGRPGRPARFVREPTATHYAASMMKVAVLLALHRGGHPLSDDIPVRNDFASAAPGGGRFGCRESYDSDPLVWRRLGGSAPLGWLAERMIVASSNLATNLVLARVGLPEVAQALTAAGAVDSTVVRGIEDTAAADAGLTNLVTAADLAAVLGAMERGVLDGVRPAACAAMLTTLRAQQRTEDLAAGLPPGTPVALKNGWIMGVRHAAGVVYPPGEPPYLLAVCMSTPWAVNRHDDEACQLVAQVSAAAWADRLTLP
jgi:beta-lactamase class A